jgi:hypothetical protein
MVARVVLGRRLVENLPADPVAFWLGYMDPVTQPTYRRLLNRWIWWLQKQPGWEGAGPRDVLVRHLESEDPYVVLDLVEGWVQSLPLRKTSKRHSLTTLRSFFLHNHAELPRNPHFRIQSQRPAVRAMLDAKDVVELYHAATVRFRSVILFKWQSFMDTARLLYANEHCSDQIVAQIEAGTLPVRIDLPGRKANENDIEGEYFTFIHKDASDALEKYFEEYRGWPKKGEPIWVQKNHQPLTHWTFDQTWLRLLRRIGKIPPTEGPRGTRYGYNPHEMRDEATTRLHIALKSQGFDMDCVKFWCGQVGQIDALKYDKFFQRDQNYVRSQYEVAAPYLNIISNPLTQAQNTDQVKNMQQQIDALNLAVRMLQDASRLKVVQT